MLPTPDKFHYMFNLRDLSRITQGFIKSTPEDINTVPKILHQFTNECYRVLPDRFVSNEDIKWFSDTCVPSVIRETFRDEAI